LLADAEQVAQDALSDVADIRRDPWRSGLQGFEAAGELPDRALERGFGTQAFGDQGVDPRDQRLVLEHHPLRVEHRRVHFGYGFLDALLGSV
jgi:hypothetical protein